MADKKETRSDELKDLDPKKDPKGGMTIQSDEPGTEQRGETPRYRG